MKRYFVFCLVVCSFAAGAFVACPRFGCAQEVTEGISGSTLDLLEEAPRAFSSLAQGKANPEAPTGESRSDAMPSDVKALLEKHKPILVFSLEDYSYPTDVDAMLRQSWLVDPGSESRIDLSKLEQEEVEAMLRRFNNADAYLELQKDFRDVMKEDMDALRRGDKPARWPPKLYTRVMQTEDKIVLQYWAFHPGSSLPKTLGLFGGSWHEGDWEMSQVILDAGTKEVVGITASQHYAGEGRTVVDAEREGDRAVMRIAEGSHATYFEGGWHKTGPGKLGNFLKDWSWLTQDYAPGKPRVPEWLPGRHPRGEVIVQHYDLEAVEGNPVFQWKGMWGKVEIGGSGMGRTGPVGPVRTVKSLLNRGGGAEDVKAKTPWLVRVLLRQGAWQARQDADVAAVRSGPLGPEFQEKTFLGSGSQDGGRKSLTISAGKPVDFHYLNMLPTSRIRTYLLGQMVRWVFLNPILMPFVSRMLSATNVEPSPAFEKKVLDTGRRVEAILDGLSGGGVTDNTKSRFSLLDRFFFDPELSGISDLSELRREVQKRVSATGPGTSLLDRLAEVKGLLRSLRAPPVESQRSAGPINPKALERLYEAVIENVAGSTRVGSHFPALVSTGFEQDAPLIGALQVEERGGVVRCTCPVGNVIEVNLRTGEYNVFESDWRSSERVGKTTRLYEGKITVLTDGGGATTVGPTKDVSALKTLLSGYFDRIVRDIEKKYGGVKLGKYFRALLEGSVRPREGERLVGSLRVKVDGDIVAATCPIGNRVELNLKTGDYWIYAADIKNLKLDDVKLEKQGRIDAPSDMVPLRIPFVSGKAGQAKDTTTSMLDKLDGISREVEKGERSKKPVVRARR